MVVAGIYMHDYGSSQIISEIDVKLLIKLQFQLLRCNFFSRYFFNFMEVIAIIMQ